MSKLKLKLPLILLNFKTYSSSIGERGLRLAKMIEETSLESGIQIIISPQYTDIFRISSAISTPVFSQHLDYQEPGKHTGFVLPEALVASGCRGTLLNHAEQPISHDDVRRAVERCRGLDLVSCVSSSGVEESSLLASINPDMLLVELPELIGSGKAISTVKPGVITSAVEAVRAKNSKVVLVAGSGISTKEDVRTALELGMDAVGASKAIMDTQDPKGVLQEMVEAVSTK
ncbi:MAG: triose-phosphate isomerase [Nitrososphaerales archaeon]